MSEEKKADSEERDESSGNGTGGEGQQDDAAAKAQAAAEERDKAKETMKELEEDPPGDLEEWPDDASKYETFGGAEGEHSYDEGPEKKLGPSSLRHREDGKVEIAGEEVDDPEEYKGDPIPGGPTDENASQDLTTERIRGKDDDAEGQDDATDKANEGSSADSERGEGKQQKTGEGDSEQQGARGAGDRN